MFPYNLKYCLLTAILLGGMISINGEEISNTLITTDLKDENTDSQDNNVDKYPNKESNSIPMNREDSIMDEIRNYNTTGIYNRSSLETIMENVTAEIKKAVVILEEQKHDIEPPIWADIFAQPYPKLEDCQVDLDVSNPLYEAMMVSKETAYGDVIIDTVGNSRHNFQVVITQFIRNYASLTQRILRQQIDILSQNYQKTILPRIKRIELDTFVSQLERQIDEQYKQEQDRFTTEQRRILDQAHQGPMEKSKIMTALKQLIENQNQKQIDDKRLVDDLVKQAETGAGIQQDQQLKGFSVDLISLVGYSFQRLEIVKALHKSALIKLKQFYQQLALRQLDTLAEQELAIYTDYLNRVNRTKKSFQEQEISAREIDMPAAFENHKTIAVAVENSRTAIRHLPELFRAVKVRTATMALSYFNLALILVGIFGVFILFSLVVTRIILTNKKQKDKKKMGILTTGQKMDQWREPKLRRQIRYNY